MARTGLSEILKRASRPLCLSMHALPGAMRPVCSSAALLCRAARAVAETPRLERIRRLHWIDRFPAMLESRKLRADRLGGLLDETAAGNGPQEELELLRALPDVFASADALAPQDRSLAYQVLHEVCSGLETDLSVFGSDEDSLSALATPQQLEQYCRSMGGGPGVFCTEAAIRHCGVRDPGGELAEQGRMIGSALQLISIMCDTTRDLRAGRCYWPESDLARASLSPRNLLNPDCIIEFRKVLLPWTLWAVKRLTASEKYVCALPQAQFKLRGAVIQPVYWGLDALQQIWKSGNPLSPRLARETQCAQLWSQPAKTTAVLAGDVAFIKGYRLRRETLFSLLYPEE